MELRTLAWYQATCVTRLNVAVDLWNYFFHTLHETRQSMSQLDRLEAYGTNGAHRPFGLRMLRREENCGAELCKTAVEC